ncbi:MAG: hypothetical protein ACJAWA_002137, partial [Nonlabens sp.]
PLTGKNSLNCQKIPHKFSDKKTAFSLLQRKNAVDDNIYP